MKKSRGTSYPSMTLEDAINKLRVIDKGLGRASGDRIEILQMMSYKGESGPSARAIASMGYYGLLRKEPDSKYSVSEAGLKILYAEDPSDKSHLRNAAVSPDLYGKLYERYQGNELPATLSNTLVLSYGINASSAETAARNFRATLAFAGLISPEGKVFAADNEGEAGDIANSPASSQAQQQQQATTDHSAPRQLPSGIIVIFPKDLDHFVTFGKFGDVIQDLDDKANALREGISNESGPPQV